MSLAGLFAGSLTATALVAQPDEPARPVNRLARETSPYLQQHQHNPVDWYPWGPEALAKAKADGRPIFLSIGYAACHWCHVMEHESFEDPATAKLMNELFVNVKVDREERPDLDEIYMAATVRFTGGHGGWPMSVFLTPDLQPFFAGTYFPPEDKWGQPAFKRVLQHVAGLWKDRRSDVDRAAAEMAGELRRQLAPELAAGEPTAAMIAAAVESARERFDAPHAGFAYPPRFAPKFPHASELQVLLRAASVAQPDVLEMVETTLQKMACGGMYDQLGGGFHRYSVDRLWVVPHFEKMLYDNAQLVRVYLEAHAVTGNAFYAEVAADTLAWLLREMIDPRGGVWSTQDADSEGEEGRFFVWDVAEVADVLGKDEAALAAKVWGLTTAGNFEGKNIPVRPHGTQAPPCDATKARDLRARLLAARGRRVRPATDDKVLAAWNGLAISALAHGYRSLGDPRYLATAQAAARFVLSAMREKGRLLRTWRRGEARLAGYLEDHAGMADALLDLFETDFDPAWLAAAKDLLGELEARFLDPTDGAFWFTADDHEALVARSKAVSESSTPTGGALAARAFLRAGLLLGDPRLYDIGARSLRAHHDLLIRLPAGCPSLVLAVQFHLGDPREVVIAGDPSDARTQALLGAARMAWPPHLAMLCVHAGNRGSLEALAPLVAGKAEVDGAPAAYVCRRGVCERPVTDAAALAAALRR